jgi:D-alanyl-D-alanine carboxypeptidase
MHRAALRAVLQFSILFLGCSVGAKRAHAQAQLSPEMQHKIDDIATAALAKTGVPSASLAVVKDGHIAYLHAYGNARLDPQTAATPQMRYSIGSVSKQFTAASILLLQQEGKLSLDDKVGKFLPDLTRASDVTIREILSHTSGYQDYWPQDYVMPEMLQPTTARKILDVWARKPLDFEPGTKWQYSNTNYVIAGLIVEKASGQPLLQFLQQHIFTPLDMKSVADTDQAKLGDTDPTGYMRYALGPVRPAPKEGTGWLFAAGELAMAADDLAKWDISIMNQSLLKPASYRDFATEVVLANGLGTRYGLGVDVRSEFDRRELSHSGEVSGFTSENDVYPDDHVAVVVLTNEDASDAAEAIAKGIAPLLLASDGAATPEKLAQAQRIFAGLQRGTIDRSLFTDNANSYFSEQALQDFASSLGPLGSSQEFVQTRQALRGGMTLRIYSVKFAKIELTAWTYEMPDGKLEQFQVAPAD